MSGASPALLPDVDRAAFAGALAHRLRSTGVEVGLTGIETFARALAAVPPRTAGALYWLARVALVQDPGDLETFDAVFATVFGGASLGVDPAARRGWPPAPAPKRAEDRRPATGGEAPGEEQGEGLPWATRAPPVAPAADEDAATAIPERLPSRLETVAGSPFAQLDPADLAVLDRWLTDALRRWPTRRSRRRVRDRRGRQIGLRPTVARARRTGFEPAELVRTGPRRRPRRVVMLCDVSQSMQEYVAAYLHLMRAAALVAHAEVFAFATSLTRLTPVLVHATPQVAVELATERVVDRFGGTRIASNVRALLASRHGDACRGALVLVASDGWDSDPPEAMTAAMARLRRRAHRVLWLNPRLAAPGFQPLVGGMAAALPFCDAVLPADTVSGLADVVAAMVDDR